MKNKYISNISILAITIVSLTCLLSSQRAESKTALRALGEAYQNEYKEIRKLGPNPNAEQIKQVRKKNFSQFNQIFAQEVKQKYMKFLFTAHNIKKSFQNSLSDIKHNLHLATGKNKASSQLQVESSGQTRTAPVARSTASPPAESEGASGAKALEFNKNSKPVTKEPTVIDGIIQQR